MGFLDKGICRVTVEFYGAVAAEDGEIRAWVDAPEAPVDVGYGRNALALLLPLAAVKVLTLTVSAPMYTGETVAMYRGLADHLLGEDSGLKGFDARFDGSSLPRFPRYVDESEGKGAKTWNARLMRSRSGDRYWGKLRAPMQGAPVFALWGIVGLARYIAGKCAYEETVVPAAAGLRTLAELSGAVDWEHMGMQAEAALGGPVSGVVASPDTQEAMQSVLREFI